MPATFDSFGVRFLYPDNWTLIDRANDEGEGVTLEMPSGGFFTVEQRVGDADDRELLQQIEDMLAAEYDEVEREELATSDTGDGERAVEMRFYYLDLLVISRVVMLNVDGRQLVLQMQAESRDFEQNEMVFKAILQQIRQSLPTSKPAD